ncbi:hypothetical protein [Gemmatimonas sp.]|uniref:hypothetical protein n=1 Tax=Gemmatimonas sp. TaxID=1962908 RepID=UPI00333F2829
MTGRVVLSGQRLHRLVLGLLLAVGHGYPKLLRLGEAAPGFPDVLGFGSRTTLVLAALIECAGGLLLAFAPRPRIPAAVLTGFFALIWTTMYGGRIGGADGGELAVLYLLGCLAVAIGERPSRGALSAATAALLMLSAPVTLLGQGHTHRPGQSERAVETTATSADLLRPALPVALYDGLGTFTRPADTASDSAQLFVNQGWRLAYAFARGAAEAAFAEAARRDTSCAMCWWGVAWAAGPYLNDPEPSAAALVRAAAAARRAWQLREHAQPADRALIDAMQVRYTPTDSGPQLAHQTYARALGAAHASHPRDDDIAALLGEARYLAHEGLLHTADGSPRPGTSAVLDPLALVVSRSPGHAGACHLFIHAAESGARVREAEPCARLLTASMPSASHMLHMPSHVWHRLGLWGDAVRANQLAVMADERAAAGGPPSVYPQHNLRMLLGGAVMDGQYAVALSAAQRIAASSPTSTLVVSMVHARFGRFDELRRMSPVTGAPIPTAWSAVLRGLSELASGDTAAARRQLSLVDAVAASTVPTAITQDVADRDWIALARGILAGELFAAAGAVDSAVSVLNASVRIEDALPYAEHPSWLIPARHVLGGVLLDAGRHADALRILCRDLAVYPHNGWALTGVVRALPGIPGSSARAIADAEQARTAAWQRADVWIGGPRVAPRAGPIKVTAGQLVPGAAPTVRAHSVCGG